MAVRSLSALTLTPSVSRCGAALKVDTVWSLPAGETSGLDESGYSRLHSTKGVAMGIGSSAPAEASTRWYL